MVFPSTDYNSLLVIMAQILKNIIETEQSLILDTDSDEAMSSDSESDFHEDTMAVVITTMQWGSGKLQPCSQRLPG
jgi:hypothetical protein